MDGGEETRKEREMAKSVAVIGASNDRSKFGNKGVRAFKQAGWTVYPVTKEGEEVEGLKSYRSIGEVPERPDWVSMYVPPRVGLALLPEIAEKGTDELVFNPGAGGAELMEESRKLGLNPVAKCSILAIGLSPGMFPDR